MSIATSTDRDGGAEQALRDLAGTAYSHDTPSPWLAATVLRRADQRQRRRRNLVGGAALGVVLVGSVAAVAIGGGSYYEYRQPSAVMEPTVPTGSSVVVNRDLVPERLDVIHLTLDIEGEAVPGLLRVIGVEGDTVACPELTSTSCTVTVNGVPLEDEYVASLVAQPFAEVTVPEDALFLLGDVRDRAVDSRALGPVDIADVKGVVVGVVDEGGKASPVMGAPSHALPEDYEVDPELPVPPASTFQR